MDLIPPAIHLAPPIHPPAHQNIAHNTHNTFDSYVPPPGGLLVRSVSLGGTVPQWTAYPTAASLPFPPPALIVPPKTAGSIESPAMSPRSISPMPPAGRKKKATKASKASKAVIPDDVADLADLQPQPYEDESTGELTFPCPFCNKQYTGKHARSIWRRHLQDKHQIPLAAQPRKTRWDNGALRSALHI